MYLFLFNVLVCLFGMEYVPVVLLVVTKSVTYNCFVIETKYIGICNVNIGEVLNQYYNPAFSFSFLKMFRCYTLFVFCFIWFYLGTKSLNLNNIGFTHVYGA